MPLSTRARLTLSHALMSRDLGDEFADVIDAGSGTLSQYCRDRFKFKCVNYESADGICDAADAGSTAFTDVEKNALGTLLANRDIADEIATAVAP